MATKHIPDGFHAITPYLTVQSVSRLVDFLVEAFGAEVIQTSPPAADGTIAHAQLRIADSPILIGETRPEWKAIPGQIYLYVPDADASYARAVAAGADVIMPPTDMFYGDRNGGVRDPAGNVWWIATRVEKLTPDELSRRQSEYHKQA